MKNSVKAIVCVIAVLLAVTFAFSGCDFTRKLGGAETTFPSKVAKAKNLSFKMKIDYRKGDATTVVDMDCYKTSDESGTEEYAYIYSSAGALYDSYKNIYAGGKLYEIVNLTKNSGTYYIKNGVGVDDEGNILYHVTKNILLTSVAAFLSKSKKETLNDETVYRYDIDINGKSVSIWYNDKVLVKLYAEFEGENGEETEIYTLSLSDYKFDETISSDVFAKPDAYKLTYIESPLSFETWMSVITEFSSKIGK